MLTTLLRDWLLDPLGLLLIWTVFLFALHGWRTRHRARRSSRHSRRQSGSGSALVRVALFCIAWWVGAAVVSAPAIVNPLVASLENRVAAGNCAVGSPIVVLGGGVDSRTRDASRFEGMSPATLARVAEAARLARADPAVPVVLAGGAWSGRTDPDPTDPDGAAYATDGPVAEADVMAGLLESLGIASERIVRESSSTSTASNAARVAELDIGAGPASLRLVTSAIHMPRAVAAFQAANLSVCAVPVERLAVDAPAWALWPQTSAMQKFDRWLHEQLGLALYRLRGEA